MSTPIQVETAWSCPVFSIQWEDLRRRYAHSLSISAKQFSLRLTEPYRLTIEHHQIYSAALAELTFDGFRIVQLSEITTVHSPAELKLSERWGRQITFNPTSWP